MKNKIILSLGIFIFIFILSGVLFYNHLFGAPEKNAEPERFIVSLNETKEDAVQKLSAGGFIKSEWGFKIALGVSKIRPGGYKISKSQNVWQLAKALKEPYMEWVIIQEGLRKEQIAEILAEKLDWSSEEKNDWVIKYTAEKPDYSEGVYFPDTYLISKDESPEDIAKRFINKFNEKFQPYAEKFAKANIKWTTAIKLASIVQREAAGKSDMPLVAGVLWNRLLKDMRLETDCAIQYARDTSLHYNSGLTKYLSEGDWWKPISSADKNISSPYNTYKNKGLPPHPISNPGLDAISAALNPAKTECLFYLHDTEGEIHCAKTYEEHKANIEKYLR
ncbi:MAG: endolytic transglycosylase MltG [Candidatus Paceibacterota bacterium]